MVSPKNIVITGSTRGIGYGLAEAFLQLGCAVMVSGRSPESTGAAVAQLAARYDPVRVFGLVCVENVLEIHSQSIRQEPGL